MRLVRARVSGLMLATSAVVSAQQLSAQQNGSGGSPTLEERVDELDQQIRILQRLRELAADSAATAAKDKATRPTPARTASTSSRPTGTTPSGSAATSRATGGSSRAASRADHRQPADPPGAPDPRGDRRPVLRLPPHAGLRRRLAHDLRRLLGREVRPAFTVRAGKFKPPVGLERLQSATDIVFAERGFPTNLVPSRDIGLQVAGDISEGVLAYQVGVFNGVPDLANGGDDLSDAKDFAGARVRPAVQGGHAARVSASASAASTGFERGSTADTGLPAYRTPGQQTFFRYRSRPRRPPTPSSPTASAPRLSPQAYFYTGPLGLLGEYVISRNEVTRSWRRRPELDHKAWQATGSYFLTGEKAGFRSPAPKKPFDLKEGGFGAVELVARYGELDARRGLVPGLRQSGPERARRPKAWGVGSQLALHPRGQGGGELRAHHLHRRRRHGRPRAGECA